jgi:hypothetical protein
MVEQLEAIFDRLRRAEEHLDAIKEELLSYYNADPCQMRGKYKLDADGHRGTGEWTIRVEVLPVRLNTLIGEFLHDLRSALDHLAWQLVLHDGGQPSGDTSFPILKVTPSANKQGEQTLPNVAGGLLTPARALIDGAQPYRLGARYADHPLWMLHQLWNIDKHRHVLAKGGRTTAHFIGASPTHDFAYTARFDSATVDAAKYILVPDDPSVDVDAHALVEVALNEPDHGIETPLLWTLEQILKSVLGVVAAAEDRCF